MTSLENIRVFTQSAIRIQSKDGMVIYLDPFSLTDAEAAHDADYVFITHAHFDHFSPEDIARVAGDHTELVAPASMGAEVARVADEIGATAVHLLQAGGRLELPGVAVETVPAYNVEQERLEMHPQANGWLGYALTVDGVRYYAAGDTDQNPDNEQVACDVALVPIGGRPASGRGVRERAAPENRGAHPLRQHRGCVGELRRVRRRGRARDRSRAEG